MQRNGACLVGVIELARARIWRWSKADLLQSKERPGYVMIILTGEGGTFGISSGASERV
jgi:hypothetical protein